MASADIGAERGPLVHDVLIIGAGPCGLAVAARLRESTPSALFTDDEHQRYHWIKRHNGQNMSIKNWKNGRITQQADSVKSQSTARYSTVILDSTAGTFMARWNQLFKMFEISHLRSPMFFHVDPGERDNLLAYVYEQGRESEIKEIKGCVGQEMSKHQKKKRPKVSGGARTRIQIEERDRKDYFTPSRQVFSDHCQCIMNRYQLSDASIKQEMVKDIQFDTPSKVAADEPLSAPLSAADEKIFAVRTNQGIHYAKTVVLATGAGSVPCIPGLKPSEQVEGACHSMHIRDFPHDSLQAKIRQRRPTNIIVVGGGLTSAQLADLAIRKGVSRVYLLMRGPCKVKPFDIDLNWMGKFRNFEQASFWSADTDEERLEMIQTARNGGSITPPFHALLKQHIRTGKLELHTHTTLTFPSRQPYDAATSRWTDLTTNPPISNLPAIDYIYFATGVATSFSTIPYLQTLLQQYPVDTCGGMPCLNDDLMWSDDVPLFVTGRLAGLRLGPGAGNLGGARLGAERVVWGLEEVLGQSKSDNTQVDKAEQRDYGRDFSGGGNRFGGLVDQTE